MCTSNFLKVRNCPRVPDTQTQSLFHKVSVSQKKNKKKKQTKKTGCYFIILKKKGKKSLIQIMP